jgi:hypothetical protein
MCNGATPEKWDCKFVSVNRSGVPPRFQLNRFKVRRTQSRQAQQHLRGVYAQDIRSAQKRVEASSYLPEQVRWCITARLWIRTKVQLGNSPFAGCRLPMSTQCQSRLRVWLWLYTSTYRNMSEIQGWGLGPIICGLYQDARTIKLLHSAPGSWQVCLPFHLQ